MSKPVEVPNGDDQDWPTNCPLCDTKLAAAVIDFDTQNENRAELQAGEMVAVDYCPNPACPGKSVSPSAQEPGS